MKKEEVFEKVRKIILDWLGKDIAVDVSMESNLKGDLGMDSLDILQIVFMIENTFDIKVEDEKLDTFVTVADLVNEVMAKCNDN